MPRFLERILGDPETPLVPDYTLVPDEEIERDEPAPDLGDADNAGEARKREGQKDE